MASLRLELGALAGLVGLDVLGGLGLDGLDHLVVLVLVQLQQLPYTPENIPSSFRESFAFNVYLKEILNKVACTNSYVSPSCDSSQLSLGKILACRIHSCKAFLQCDFSRDAVGRRPVAQLLN